MTTYPYDVESLCCAIRRAKRDFLPFHTYRYYDTWLLYNPIRTTPISRDTLDITESLRSYTMCGIAGGIVTRLSFTRLEDAKKAAINWVSDYV